jgi:hypothetical protein
MAGKGKRLGSGAQLRVTKVSQKLQFSNLCSA